MNISGILLAGGKSTRLKMSKLGIKVGPLPLLVDQILKMSFFCTEIILSTSEKKQGQISDYLNRIDYYFKLADAQKHWLRHGRTMPPVIKMVKDRNVCPAGGIKNKGPILGIYSGLKEIKKDYALVLAVDMPLISFRMLDMLVKEIKRDPRDAYIIKTEKGYEVLCGLYSASCLETIAENIAANKYRVSDCFNKLNVKIIGGQVLKQQQLDMLNFFNINTGQDFKRFKHIWGECQTGVCDLDSFKKKWANFFFR